MSAQQQHDIIPREKLDFGLESDDIPRFWFGNSPFKTRSFDALSVIFPPGERYFMTSVRAFRDDVQDPQLLKDIKDFMRQEGQHGRVHALYNDRLARQGIDVDAKTAELNAFFDEKTRTRSPAYNLALTSGTEHLTAILADALFTRKEAMADADERLRAMYAWHAIEEIEHKAVSFDVMQKVARVGYFTRVIALLEATFWFFRFTQKFQTQMLKEDGFTLRQRIGFRFQQLAWMFGPRKGIATPVLGLYFEYLKPGFHPWHQAQMKGYPTWLAAFGGSQDPIEAGNALHAQGV